MPPSWTAPAKQNDTAAVELLQLPSGGWLTCLPAPASRLVSPRLSSIRRSRL